MSTFRHPVGDRPPSVYWRRRLVVGIGVIVVIVIILLIVFAQRGGTKPTAAPTHTTSSASTSKPASTKAPACSAGDLSVTAKVDAPSYSTESQPQLSFVLVNDGSTACTVKAGSDVQVFEITSGSEVYWKSTDCQTGAQPFTKVMQPGDRLSPSAAVGWDRTRSSKSTCNSSRTAVPAGGASYHLVVTVDGVKSTNKVQFVLK